MEEEMGCHQKWGQDSENIQSIWRYFDKFQLFIFFQKKEGDLLQEIKLTGTTLALCGPEGTSHKRNHVIFISQNFEEIFLAVESEDAQMKWKEKLLKAGCKEESKKPDNGQDSSGSYLSLIHLILRTISKNPIQKSDIKCRKLWRISDTLLQNSRYSRISSQKRRKERRKATTTRSSTGEEEEKLLESNRGSRGSKSL